MLDRAALVETGLEWLALDVGHRGPHTVVLVGKADSELSALYLVKAHALILPVELLGHWEQRNEACSVVELGCFSKDHFPWVRLSLGLSLVLEVSHAQVSGIGLVVEQQPFGT